MKNFWVATAFLFIGLTSKAAPLPTKTVTVFLDLNNSTGEIARVRQQVQKEGGELVIIPSLLATPREGIELNQDYLREQLSHLGRGDIRLMISGHSQGVMVSGTVGSVAVDDVAKAIQDSGRRNDVRSVYALGCYTVTRGNADSWRDDYPSAHLITGSNFQGPSNTNPLGLQALTNHLTHEASLLRIGEAATLAQFQNYIRMTTGANALEYSYVYRNCFLNNRRQISNIREVPTDCLSIRSRAHDQEKRVIAPYLEENREIPLDRGLTDLRKFYHLLHENLRCFSSCLPPTNPPRVRSAEEHSIPDVGFCPQRLIHLIKFDHVADQFDRIYGARIREFIKARLPQLPATVSPSCTEQALQFRTRSYTAFRAKYENLQECMKSLRTLNSADQRTRNDLLKVTLQTATLGICVPFTWDLSSEGRQEEMEPECLAGVLHYIPSTMELPR